jgi:hypothetical protein
MDEMLKPAKVHPVAVLQQVRIPVKAASETDVKAAAVPL